MSGKITLSEVNQKRVRIIVYLMVSGVLGLALASVVENPILATIFAPAINFILYSIVEELRNNGYKAALEK